MYKSDRLSSSLELESILFVAVYATSTGYILWLNGQKRILFGKGILRSLIDIRFDRWVVFILRNIVFKEISLTLFVAIEDAFAFVKTSRVFSWPNLVAKFLFFECNHLFTSKMLCVGPYSKKLFHCVSLRYSTNFHSYKFIW